MGYSQTPFFYDGAIFYHRDFDARKVLVYCLEEFGIKKSDVKKIKKLPYNKPLSKKLRAIIETVICTDGAKTLADLRDDITSFLVNDIVSEGSLDGQDYMVRRFDYEESAVFCGEHFSDDDISSCFFITLLTTYPWKYSEYDDPSSEQEAAELIRKRLSNFVKDDIDWTKRLGELSGIYAD